ncbi:MAG TPA: hypothetical protein VGW37_03490 [Terriglobia bacterium]|nr:hypothetical protein [Terriglobia bacterium]
MQIVGYMQVFVKDIVHQGQSDNLDVVILNVSNCGDSSTGGGSSTVVASAGSPIPIRLIRTN